MTTDRNKPGVAFWASVALVAVLVGYPLSFGPACWLLDRGWLNFKLTYAVYRPLGMPLSHLPYSIQDSVLWWGELGCNSEASTSHLLLFE